jgi:hypothetical protein
VIEVRVVEDGRVGASSLDKVSGVVEDGKVGASNLDKIGGVAKVTGVVDVTRVKEVGGESRENCRSEACCDDEHGGL